MRWDKQKVENLTDNIQIYYSFLLVCRGQVTKYIVNWNIHISSAVGKEYLPRCSKWNHISNNTQLIFTSIPGTSLTLWVFRIDWQAFVWLTRHCFNESWEIWHFVLYTHYIIRKDNVNINSMTIFNKTWNVAKFAENCLYGERTDCSNLNKMIMNRIKRLNQSDSLSKTIAADHSYMQIIYTHFKYQNKFPVAFRGTWWIHCD